MRAGVQGSDDKSGKDLSQIVSEFIWEKKVRKWYSGITVIT
jgi:hypothetical protein